MKRSHLAALVARFAVGGILIVAGAAKLGYAVDLAATLAAFRLLPAWSIASLAVALPYLEVILGLYLIAGLHERLVGSLACAQFCIYAGAIASAAFRHLPLDCSCFGPSDTSIANWPHVGLDLSLAAAALFVARAAPTDFSVDAQISKHVADDRAFFNVSLVLVGVVLVAATIWTRVPTAQARQIARAAQAPAMGRATLGGIAPDFEVPTTHGIFHLADVHKPVLLEIFASWCEHCRRETAVLDRVYGAYASRVAIVGVDGSDTGMDGESPESQNDVVAFAARFNVRYPVAYDPDLTVAGLYLQGAFPTLVTIDRAKRIVALDAGPLSFGAIEVRLNRALAH